MPGQEQIDTLNELLRGEISAVETYQQAMAKIDSDPGADELRQLHDEHREAANELRKHIRSHDGTPDHGSGAWGAFAKAVEGVAKLFGNTAALKALKEGEEHGIKSYEDALQDETLPAECKELIRNRLLPQTRAHIPVLDRLMEAQ
jgi:uncharacterized protein (TIGR02284 family)